MNVLSKGITGFNKPKDLKQHAIEEIEHLIKSIKYPFVIIGEIKSPNETTNYYRISIKNKIENNSFDVLLNMYFWILSSVKPASSWMNLAFLEFDTQLKKQIINHNIEVNILGLEILNQEASINELEILGKAEVQQVEYWESKTYGEIIFNGV